MLFLKRYPMLYHTIARYSTSFHTSPYYVSYDTISRDSMVYPIDTFICVHLVFIWWSVLRLSRVLMAWVGDLLALPASSSQPSRFHYRYQLWIWSMPTVAYRMRDTFALSVSQCAIPRAGSAPEVSPSYSRKKHSKLSRAIPCYSRLFLAIPCNIS